MKTYQGHQNTRYSVGGAFGAYGDEEGEVGLGEKKAFAVSGSETGEMLWWDVQSKRVLQRERAHEGVVLGVDTWGLGGLVVSCGVDRTVRIWERETELEAGMEMEGEEEVDGEMKVEEEETGQMDR